MGISSTRSMLQLLQWITTIFLLIELSTSVQVTVRPSRFNVLQGGRAEFLCSYQPDVPSCDDTFVFWGRKGGDTLANMTYVLNPEKYDIGWGFESNGDQQVCKYTLTVKDVTKDDGGQYSCTFIRPQSGRYSIAEATARLQLVVPPPDLYPICKTSGITGLSITKAMTLVCESEPGVPSVSLTWSNDGNALPSELHKIGNNLLQLKTIMSETQILTDPVITCIMELPDPIQERRTCTVNTTTSVNIKPETVTKDVSQIVTFVCEVTTSIPFEIFWSFQNKFIEADDPYDQFIVENNAKALHVKDLTTENNNAVVTCVVSTMFGNSSGTASLSVAPKSPDNKTVFGERGNMGLIIGLVLVGLLLIVVINIIVCLKCKRPSQPSNKTKTSSPSKTEYTMVPLSPNQAAASNHDSTVTVSETQPKVEKQYLDMNARLKKPTTNDTYYAPMKSSKRNSGEDYTDMKAKSVEGVADENEYMLSSKSDDDNTYMYSSTDSLTKVGKANTNAKPVTASKPIKPQQDVSKTNQSRPELKKQKTEDTVTPAALGEHDANDYEILSKNIQHNPRRGKLNKVSSETGPTVSNSDNYKSSPRLLRNISAPQMTEQPEYAVPTDILIHETVPENSSPKPTQAPVYDIPNDLQQKTNIIHKKINAFEKSAEKSPSAQLRSAMKPPVLHKKPKRHSDPNSTDEDSIPKTSASNRASLPQDSNQYLTPSVSQQSLDKIAVTTPPVINESRSPILKKVRMPFKAKNNNKDVYQSLHRNSMDNTCPDYQVLIGKVDDSQLYENVATGPIV